MTAVSKNFIILLTIVCLTGITLATPKENTLGAVITRNAKMHMDRSI